MKQFLPNNSRPSYTGQGLTEKQKAFFSTPKTMKQIAEILFKGDYWAANNFQNKYLSGAVLKINEDATIELIDWSK
jgi:hypothetical protein